MTIFEARERIGGRIETVPGPDGHAPAELGAEFIHGAAPLTRALLREAGLSERPRGDRSWMLREGTLLPNDGFEDPTRLLASAADSDPDVTIDRFLEPFAADRKTAQLAAIARQFVEGFDAADPAIASAKSIGLELASGTDSSSDRPEGGYGRLVEHLLNLLHGSVEVITSARVLGVAWHPKPVTLQLSGRAPVPTSTFAARKAIVTVPAGVLRSTGHSGMVFSPTLPAEKAQALAHIETGAVVKVSLWFRTAFWTELEDGRYRDAAFFRSDRAPFPTFWTLYPENSPLVVAWVGGPEAARLSQTPAADVVASAVDGFGALFGRVELARSMLRATSYTDWQSDPNAMGAYSYLRVGAGDAREALAAPVDNVLFFAGEATASHGEGGTVEGALESGERAAREALASLKAEGG